MGNSKSKSKGEMAISSPTNVNVPQKFMQQPQQSSLPVIEENTTSDPVLTDVRVPSNNARPSLDMNNKRDSVSPIQPIAQSSHNIAKKEGLDDSLTEFQGNDDNMTAEDSFAHWDKAASAKAGVDSNSVGGNKAINKKLQQTMKQTMKNTMCNGDLHQLVKLPPSVELNEWLALNSIHFYRTCSLIGETYRGLCTPDTCPLMSAGNVEYLWKDLNQYPRPTRVPACVYMELSLREALATIDDESVFIVDDCSPFPRDFIVKVREIFKRLFRQFAHLYYSHYDQIKGGGSNKHLNSSFKHFILFVLEFELVDHASLAPLQKFIDHIVTQRKK